MLPFVCVQVLFCETLCLLNRVMPGSLNFMGTKEGRARRGEGGGSDRGIEGGARTGPCLITRPF